MAARSIVSYRPVTDHRKSPFHRPMRVLGIGIAIAVVVFALTGGHLVFLPLLFLPFGLFSMGQRKQQRRRSDRDEFPRFR
jgi:hypothetical protein